MKKKYLFILGLLPITSMVMNTTNIEASNIYTETLDVIKDELGRDRTITITLNNLDYIEDIFVDNGGEVEVLDIDGDQVTIRIFGGTPINSIFLRNELVPEESKYIYDYHDEDYEDNQGFKGTLSPYREVLSSERPSYFYTYVYTNNPDDLPSTKKYYFDNDISDGSISDEENYVILYKGQSIYYPYGDSSNRASSKYVSGQEYSYYREPSIDGKGDYEGRLSKYIEGSNANSKIITVSKTSLTNVFETTFNYNQEFSDNGVITSYSGVLTKLSNPYYGVISSSGSKYIDSHPTEYYSDADGYSGYLLHYLKTVGSKEKTEQVSNIIEKEYNHNETPTFPTTNLYSKTIDDNGITITYAGNLNKNGNYNSVLISGTSSDTKYIENYSTSNYNQNGYTGILTANYKDIGSVSSSKSVTSSRTGTSNSFDNTIPYTETINDNGVTTTYNGTLTKNGNATATTVRAGSISETKTVTNQTNPNYVENITDNGVSTSYSGTLNGYVYQGSTSASKPATNLITNTSNNFEATIPYRETINDNGISTTYSGSLSRNGNAYVYSGEYGGTLYVNNQLSQYYNNDGYTGTLTQYVASGSDAASKTVTDQPSSSYSDTQGYTGTLTQYVASGSDAASKTVTAQTSAYYNSGGYSGTLSSYIYQGSASNEKTVTAVDYYNWGWHCTNGVLQRKAESIGATEYLSKNPNFIPGSEKLDTSKYNYNEYVSNDNGRSTYYSGILSFDKKTTESTYRSLTGGNETGLLLQCPNGTPTPVDSRTRYTVKVTWIGTVTKPDTRVYRYQGTVYTSDTRVYRYQGTVNKPDTRVYRYQGYVTKPDTRVYAQTYSGTVTKPDTRVIRYSGTVTKPDTRLYNYVQNYSGTVTKPDTRTMIISNYSGYVTRPETRKYKATQSYSGLITKPNTLQQIDAYDGYVDKNPIYGYTQNYSGVVNKPDTRRYSYAGWVYKPDTSGLYKVLYSIEEYRRPTSLHPTVKYEGLVTKPGYIKAIYENYYEYTVTANYISF